MHAYRQIRKNKGYRSVLRLVGLLVIGMLFLAGCASSAGNSPTATAAVVVPLTGVTTTGEATSTGTPSPSATATSAPTNASTATSAATATNAAATTAAAPAKSGGTPTPTITPPATSAATSAATGTPSASSSANETPSATKNAPTSLTLTVKTSSSAGQYLADDKGMALYTFKKDTNGTSNCSGQCAALWPPLTVAQMAQLSINGGGDSSKFGLTSRADGSTQVTYNNQPLYYYAKDKAPGDTTGQGVGGVWSLAKP